MEEHRNCLSIAASILAVLILLLWWQWQPIVNSVIRSDLEHYARQTRAADLPLSIKEGVLDTIERLESQMDDGRQIGFFRWRRCDKAIRELLVGPFTSDKAKLVQRELRRLERKETRK